MTEAIGQDEASFANKGGNHADVSQITCGKRKRCFRAFESGEGCFEFRMGWEATAYEA